MPNEQSSVMAVFETASRCGEISRAQLSQLTGFSQVTVGKAVEQLCSCGILNERKESKGSVGRKSGVCSLVKNLGMLLYDFSADKYRVRVCDIALNIHGEYETDEKDIGQLAVAGFAHFIEVFDGELIGTGCVVRDGERDVTAKAFIEALGHAPELIIEDSRAYAAANTSRLDAAGLVMLVRLYAGGDMDGAITYGGRIYSGAHGKAGGFSRIAGGSEAPAAILASLCAVIDPEIVHISCERESDCDIFPDELRNKLSKLGFDDESQPQIITEPICICRTASDGAAVLLREQYIQSKLTKNT